MEGKLCSVVSVLGGELREKQKKKANIRLITSFLVSFCYIYNASIKSSNLSISNCHG
jgi:hypothetical protein